MPPQLAAFTNRFHEMTHSLATESDETGNLTDKHACICGSGVPYANGLCDCELGACMHVAKIAAILLGPVVPFPCAGLAF